MFIDFGYASNPEDVIHNALLVLSNQIDFEEQFLVNQAVEIEKSNIKNSNLKTFSFNEVFHKAGLYRIYNNNIITNYNQGSCN